MGLQTHALSRPKTILNLAEESTAAAPVDRQAPMAPGPSTKPALSKGSNCYVLQDGRWHGAMVNLILFDDLVTVKNLTTQLFHGANPKDVVVDREDIPKEGVLAPSAVEMGRKIFRPARSVSQLVSDHCPRCSFTSQV